MPSEIRTIHGRKVVLKPLDADCLLDGQLHPSIRLRLERIRELPMTAVANFHGVEIIDGRAMMIWEFLVGRGLEEVLANADQATVAKLKRDLLLVVEQLHGLGIVHGALHGRNAIVDDRGRLRITHLCPLLHNDLKIDLAAIEDIFAGARFVSPFSGKEGERTLVPTKAADIVRRRAMTGAVAAAVFGVAVAASLIWYASTQP